VKFDVKVPNDDDGHSLGTFEADSLPRVGDRFGLLGHPEVCRAKGDYYLGIVEAVTWEAYCVERRGNEKEPHELEPTVWLREEYQASVIYCTCTVLELENIQPELRTNDDGDCGNCGKTLRGVK
jgi:hypothetical protein